MNNKKLLIRALHLNISHCDENIKEEKKEIEAYKRGIQNIYNSCDHEFKEVPAMGANIVECKICGYKDGR